MFTCNLMISSLEWDKGKCIWNREASVRHPAYNIHHLPSGNLGRNASVFTKISAKALVGFGSNPK